MKKLIVLVGESNVGVANEMMTKGACATIFDVDAPLFTYLPDAFGIDKDVFKKMYMEDVKYQVPVIVKEHLIRHFFSKLQLGVRAISEYVGKEVNSPRELIEYFKKITTQSFGRGWKFKKVMDEFDMAPDGVCVICLNLLDAISLKEEGNVDAIIVLDTGFQESEILADGVIVEPIKTTAIKKGTAVLLNKLKEKWNERKK